MNTQKLSTFILGSAMLIGLGAAKGSFSQLQLAQPVQQMVVTEATAGLIASNPAALAIANSILGSTYTAAKYTELNAAIAAQHGNPQVSKLAGLYAQAVQSEIPAVVASPRKAAGLRTGLAALAVAAGLNAAEQQQVVAATSSPLFKQVAGHNIEECISTWKEDNSKKVFAYAVAAIDGQANPDNWTTAAQQLVKVKAFGDEPERDVQGDMCAAFNSPKCDILRMTGCGAGSRAPRTL
jgi:hypothetical protein